MRCCTSSFSIFYFGKEFAQLFEFLEINLPGISYPGESVFVKHKIRISRRILNQNRKYFNPLVKLWNKTRGPKFHWIVLLRSWYVLCCFVKKISVRNIKVKILFWITIDIWQPYWILNSRSKRYFKYTGK